MKKISIFLMMLCFACFGVAKAQTSLFSEGFEGGSMPTGWTTEGNGSWSVATTVNSTHPSSAGEGTYCAQIKHGTSGDATKLISPEIDLSSVTSAELSFMHVQQSWSGDVDGLKVYYRTSTSGTWTQLKSFTDAFATWTTEDGVTLPNLSSTYQIAFEYIDNWGYGLGIDNINIVPGASCPKPASLDVTSNGQSATLTWESDATQFAVAHSTDPTADPADNVVTTVSTTTYTMNNLALDADHYFWVRANCSATDQSAWTDPISVHIGYCVPAPTSVDGNGISNVTFGTGSNVVNNDTPKAYYADYSDQIGAVQAGVESTIAITFATGYTYNTFVWVDLDNSLVFDADEVICYGECTSTNPNTLTLNFTIPATQTLGDFRLRIGSADSGLGSDPTAANPCYTGYYACFQDYTLRVEAAPSCPMPSGLALTTDGTTVTATWTGTAATYNIDINGVVTPNVTSPYTFDVALSTTYTVAVEANCTGETSGYCAPQSITTPLCIGGRLIDYTMSDSYGDGWNGASITVIEGCGVMTTLTVDASSNNGTLTLCGDYYEFVWNSGSYDGECSFTFSEGGTTLFTKPSSVSDGMVLYTIGTQSCARPTDLAEANITTNSADLSWTGSNDSYVVEYTPWVAAGNDVLPTATMTTYTFPLNGTGTGSVVIRHYDVTNMFRLIVDDIVVKNASGTVIYSQDFETSGGTMPSEFTSIDMDGDGYGWTIADNSQSYVNGTYGLSSASYVSSVGALFPDNWIILSGIELGGSISFAARGQDPDFAAEKFCVYVCADADKQQEAAARDRFDLSGLTPNTPYSWNVIGICGTEESCPSLSNIFLTLDDVMVFTTDGDWNIDANWDLGRVPTIADKVRLDADATIPSGYVAYALKIVNTSTGTVTIEDGGQLKMTDNAVVKIQKEIEGYGAGNEADGDHYYFIASPLTESLFSYQSDWAYVNITGNTSSYDLYSFDAEQDLEWLNFNNSANTGDDFDRFYNGWGYLYASADDYTIEYEGSTAVASYDNTVVQDFDYDAATGGFKGWKLVGNPFTCNAYLSYVDASNTVLPADFYVMNNDKSYTLLSSDKPLAPCCGAFVSVSATGKIQFSSEVPTSPKGSMLNMNLTQGNTNVDMARIRFGEGANLGKQSFRENSTKLYMTQDNNDYAVVYADNQGEMPVSFKAEKNGTYTLNFSAENAEFSYLHLIDNMTGNEVDLLETPSYSFDAQYTDYASRFKLVFAKGNDMGSDFAFISDGQIILTGAENGATVQVIDALGRVIAQNDANNTIATDGMSAGVYVIRLINGSNVKTQKIVVK